MGFRVCLTFVSHCVNSFVIINSRPQLSLRRRFVNKGKALTTRHRYTECPTTTPLHRIDFWYIENRNI